MKQCNVRQKAGAVAGAIALVLASSAFAQDKAASSPTGATQSTSKSAAGATTGNNSLTVLEPIMLLLPTKVTVEDATKNGCWVRLYDRKNFQGDSFTLGGPIDLAEMKGPFGFNWENKVHSLETGPKTSLTIYDNRNYRDQDKKIAAGTKVADLSKKMGFFDDFRSMKMNCS
jgi:hypothetical protein